MHGADTRCGENKWRFTFRARVLGVIIPACGDSMCGSFRIFQKDGPSLLHGHNLSGGQYMASIWPVYGQCSQAVCWAALCHTVVTQSPGNTRQHPPHPALGCEFWNTLYNIPVIEGQKVRGKSMIYFDWVKMSWPGHDAHASDIVPKRQSSC